MNYAGASHALAPSATPNYIQGGVKLKTLANRPYTLFALLSALLIVVLLIPR